MTACPRTFEVEALRDGRLSGAERVGFERHLSTCAACARELEALERLAAALSASHPEHTDELHARRERTRLLAAFDRALVGQESRDTPRHGVSRRAIAAGLAAAALAAGGLWLAARPNAPASPASAVAVRPATGARWSRSTGAGRERVVLDEGQLWIQVRRSGTEPPLLVLLPDGELEDVGTTFTVVVGSGRTTRVAVEEGSVVLRLRGQAPRTIDANGSWAAAPEAAAELGPAPEPTPDRGVAPAAPVPPSRAAAPASAPRLSGSADAPAVRGAPGVASASEAFKAALLAFNGGNGRDAAARFSRFLEEHPRDPRAEDAAYLRVLAHQRGGDSAALRRTARDYLARYPSGFRRREVEALLSAVP